MAGGMITPCGKKRTSRRRSTQLNSTINVTPLVDVMLVLMVIFMIAAPMLSIGGIAVNLPKTSSDTLPNDPKDEPLIISIDAHKNLFLQEQEMTFEAIEEKLHHLTKQNPDLRIYLKGDAAVSYGEVLKVMGALHKTGLTKVGLLTQQADTPASKKETMRKKNSPSPIKKPR
jgi:biopolymer transport protein TolR